MKSFYEWADENKLLIEFDPNRGTSGRNVPAMYSGKDYPGKEAQQAGYYDTLTLDNPATRKRRLNQIVSYLQQNGPHVGMKIIRDSEFNDPAVKQILAAHTGNSDRFVGGTNDLTLTTSTNRDVDKRSRNDKEYSDENKLFKNIKKMRPSLTGKNTY